MTNIVGMVLMVLSVETNVLDTGLREFSICGDTNCCKGFTGHAIPITQTNVYYRIGTTNGVSLFTVRATTGGGK